MKLAIEYFGPVGDRMGPGSDTVTLDDRSVSLESLIDRIAKQLENGEAIRDPHLRIAINDQLCGKTDILTLNDGDRIAFLSPFSGG